MQNTEWTFDNDPGLYTYYVEMSCRANFENTPRAHISLDRSDTSAPLILSEYYQPLSITHTRNQTEDGQPRYVYRPLNPPRPL
jgi:hypothetical protein